ncbi:MAG: hypothetical protein WAK35_03860, partial [Xanthobacteraceae bacterium]
RWAKAGVASVATTRAEKASLVAREFIVAFSMTIARDAYLRDILQCTREFTSRRCHKFFIENHSVIRNIFAIYPVLVIAVQ